MAPVRREAALLNAPAPPGPSATPHNLPFAVTRMIGRDEAAAALLGGAPGVNILATSREPLGVAGEREYASDRAAVRSRRPD